MLSFITPFLCCGAFFVSKVKELGTSDECVGANLRCACFCDSNWYNEDKRLVCSNLEASGLTLGLTPPTSSVPGTYLNHSCYLDLCLGLR